MLYNTRKKEKKIEPRAKCKYYSTQRRHKWLEAFMLYALKCSFAIKLKREKLRQPPAAQPAGHKQICCRQIGWSFTLDMLFPADITAFIRTDLQSWHRHYVTPVLLTHLAPDSAHKILSDPKISPWCSMYWSACYRKSTECVLSVLKPDPQAKETAAEQTPKWCASGGDDVWLFGLCLLGVTGRFFFFYNQTEQCDLLLSDHTPCIV